MLGRTLTRSVGRCALLASLLLAACASEAPEATPGDPDDPACESRTALPNGWSPVPTVSTGAVANDSAASGNASVATIDASAGGFGESASQPFVYVRFGEAGLEKIAIGDEEAFDSADWDLAFKRYVIRANGGDSGAGGVTVARVAAASLADVAEAPPASAFVADDWTDHACEPVLDVLGAPETAIGAWYVANEMRLSPRPEVYVVKRADGTSFKLRLVSYYADASDPARSGVFRVEWAAL